jgi:hypothetical protein
MTLQERLEMLAGVFRVLVIDDGDEESDTKKGYDVLRSEKFPGLFRVDRAYHFNQREGRGKSGLKYLLEKKYDLILLDCVFHGQSDQGCDMAWAIREGFKGYHGISVEQGGLNKETQIFGVSAQWEDSDKKTCGLNAIVRATNGCTAAYKLEFALCNFLNEQRRLRGYEEREVHLREMFHGEELQRCHDLETNEVHAWGPPRDVFIHVSTDALLAWCVHFPPGAVYRTGKMDMETIGASHQVPMFRQPTQEQTRWNGGLIEGATRVPAPGLPRLLDIAKWALMEDAAADRPGDLASMLEMNWTPGAKKYGLTVLELTDEKNLTDEGKAKGFMPTPDDLHPWLMKNGRKLGDIAEYEGHKLVLIAFIPLDGVEYAAFVPAEEVQL